MAVTTYDPKQILITLGGVPVSGFADGTFVTVERDEDAFSKVVGADGITSRAKSNNRGGVITVTLQQTSPANDTLSGFLLADETSNNGIFPIMVKDNSGRSLNFSATGWVKKAPSQEYGKEIATREWEIDVADLDVFIGGN